VLLLAGIVVGGLAAVPAVGEGIQRRAVPQSQPREHGKAVKSAAHGEFEPGEVLVGFGRSASTQSRANAMQTVDARPQGEVELFGATLMSLPSEVTIAEAMTVLSRQPGVKWVVPNMKAQFDEVIPTDPLFAEQWGLTNVGQTHAIADPPPPSVEGLSDADIDASDAWSTTTGSAETVIAVIDSGIDATHPELASSLWTNPDETPGNGIDDDGNGYVDDVYGWDFIENDATPQDSEGHGTFVAGVIAAAQSNSIGGTGVCPGCRIMALRERNLAQELSSISYAIENGADIINASYGYDVFLQPEWKAFAVAYRKGILSVVSAGNSAGNNDMALGDFDHDGQYDAPSFPASFDLPGIVSVAASNDHDEYGFATGCYIATRSDACSFTSFGHDSVDVAAPGVDITSTTPGGNYATEDGTSFSAPMVAGVAGLVKSLHPTLSPLQLRNAVLNSVNRPASLAGGWTATSGRVNAASALVAPTGTAVLLSSGNVLTAKVTRGRSNGSLSYPRNVNDVYKARLRRGISYGILLDVPAGRDFDLYVWKPGTVQIWQFEPSCNGRGGCQSLLVSSARGEGKDELVTFRARRTGTYYFQVTSYFSTGKYRLSAGVV
jgi:subtilisin family serine protease